MNEIQLKYGCNPNQKPARIFMADGGSLPVTVLNGKPGYINFLDALNSWQLVKELKENTGRAAAASFKHVSPAGAALGFPLDDVLRRMYHIAPGLELSDLACAYARARGADRMSSFGDWIALVRSVRDFHANIIKNESPLDGINRPGYDNPGAWKILKSKKGETTMSSPSDPNYVPAESSTKQVFGINLPQQGRNELKIDARMLETSLTGNKTLFRRAEARSRAGRLHSNAQVHAVQQRLLRSGRPGHRRGRARRQQRPHPLQRGWPARRPISASCATCQKCWIWLSARGFQAQPRQRHRRLSGGHARRRESARRVGRNFSRRPEPLSAEERKPWLAGVTGVCLGSDAFFPFGDNIERARRSGVAAIVEPGGSIRDRQVMDSCDKYGIVMAFCGLRLFHH